MELIAKPISEWRADFPQLFLLHTHYQLPHHQSYTLRSLVHAIDTASFAGCNEADPSLYKMLRKVFEASFLAVLSKKELTYWSNPMNEEDNLEKHVREKNETFQAFHQRLLLQHKDALSAASQRKLVFLLPLLQRTEMLLSSGGDDRLTLAITETSESSKLNKYLSSTIPRAGPLIRRGSCTCSTIVDEVFLEAEKLRVECLQKILLNDNNEVEKVLMTLNDSLRDRLNRILRGEDEKDHIPFTSLLFPSGSDAELLPVLVALLRHKSLKERQSSVNGEGNSFVLNCVVAGGEVGSGTPNACEGKHFSSVSPSGRVLENNRPLEGIDMNSVKVRQFEARDSNGAIDFKQSLIFDSVRTHLSSHPSNVAILHIVCGSKTGLVYPSLDDVCYLQTELGNRLLVVVDACQLRCRLDMVRQYLSKGFLVLLTGSKFFTGPPFSGAVILPLSIKEEIESTIAVGGHSVIPEVFHSRLIRLLYCLLYILLCS